MKVVLLDTKTGERVQSREDIYSFQWTDNNWSCDCNRRFSFNLSDEDEAELDAHEFCLGCHRFLVVDAEITAPLDWLDLTLKELNEGYLIELLASHGVDPAFIIAKEHKLTPP